MDLLLAICWYIIESTIIPAGFVKWFYLSFYVHPFFLIFIQIFLWLHLVWTCLLCIFSKLVRLASTFVSSFFFFFISSSFRSFNAKPANTTTGTTAASARVTAAQKFEKPAISVVKQTISEHKSYVLISYGRYMITEASSEFQMGVVESDHLLEENHDHVPDALINQEEEEDDEEEEEVGGEEDEEQGLASEEAIGILIWQHDHLSSSFSSSTLTISDSSLHTTSIVAENLEDTAVMENGGGYSKEEDTDPFYQKYSDRMRWFDMLNQDRTVAIGEILESELDMSQNPNMPCSSSWLKKMRVLLRSLESDLELVYVAHTCLSWDALYHQYKKVEDVHAQSMNMNMNMNLSNNYNYSNIVADRFQKFQILLERFAEEKDSKKMRHFNYVHSRLISLNTLLQVPPLSDQEVMLIGPMAEGSRAIGVAKGIEKCIEAFWQYIRTTDKKKKNILKRFPWIPSPPPVEDPRDIKLFLELTGTLKKKEMWMKELQGKRRCCFRKLAARPAIQEEYEKKVMMFTSIEMKLVAMVLNMSVVSSSHLEWCQYKLNSSHFTHGGKIIPTTSHLTALNSCLFPIS